MHRDALKLDRIIRLPELLHITGLSTPTLYRLMAEGSFPQQVRLSRNSVGWRSSAVTAWLEALPEVQPARHAERSRKPLAGRTTRRSKQRTEGAHEGERRSDAKR